MGGGKLEVIGGSMPAVKEAVSFIQQDEMVDAFGASAYHSAVIASFLTTSSSCCCSHQHHWSVGTQGCIGWFARHQLSSSHHNWPLLRTAGNVTKVKQQKKTLSNKEKKKRDRLRAAKKKAGEPVSDSDEDDY